MKRVYSILTSILILSMFILPQTTFGQEEGNEDAKKEKKKSSFSGYVFITGDIGPSWWHGDLARYGSLPDLTNTSINGSLGFGWQFLSWLNVYGKVNRAFAKGEQENILPKNNIGAGAFVHQDLKTDVDMYGGDIQIGLNLFNLFGGYKERLFSISLHGGVGQSQWKSRTDDLKTDKRVATSGYDGEPSYAGSGGGMNKRNVDLTIPFGGELTFAVAEKWDVYGDYTYTWMQTDWADNVKHGEMAFINDAYSQFNIGLRYKFRKNKIKNMADDFDEVQLVTTPIPLEEVGDSVEVTIKGTFPPKYFDKKAVMCFTPVLTYEGGQTEFETMNFKGENVEGDGELISHANGGSFTYTAKVPYNPAMNVSELDVQPVIYEYNGTVYEDCADATEGKRTSIVDPPRKLADGVIHTSKYMRDDQIVDLAGHNYEIETISTQEADLFFQVNRSNKNLNLPLNKDQSNSDARDNTLSDMMQGWEVKNISIDGWASPEGEETFNQDLSMNRAGTTADYMENKITKAAKKNELIANDVWAGIEVVETANGPDWNGFMRAVEASDIKDKNAIINVINSAGDNAQKEEEIRNMILIYPELERDILPPLRRAVIDVNTYEPKKSPELIADLAVTGPQELDIEELHYAATLTDDNGTKRIIYANIIEIYPKYFRAYNNAAAIELEEGNLDLAKEHLDIALSLKDDSYEVWNNIGIYEAMTNNWVAAEEAFETSRDLGGDVDYNLGLVNIHNGEYAEAVSNLNRYSCDFNLGLAQLLNKDYSGAQKTFKCVDPQDAQTNYLIAITAARQDDKAAMLEYLGNAIKADPETKTMAAYDREFLNFEKDADFKALVGIAQ